MTDLQKKTFSEFIDNRQETVFRHGCCVGADEEAHNMAIDNDYYTVGYPPINKSWISSVVCNEMMQPKDYHDRNKDIVDSSEFLIVVPETIEEKLRSGTWSTYRYAKKTSVPGIIIFPNGELKEF